MECSGIKGSGETKTQTAPYGFANFLTKGKNGFRPEEGFDAEVSLNHSERWIGADENYNIIRTNLKAYFHVVPKVSAGLRFNGSYLPGDAAFYVYPFVHLRGIPAARYQGDNVVVAETEWRYNYYKRWSIIGFGGGGKAFTDLNTFNDTDWAYNIGTGFKYKLTKTIRYTHGT